MRNLKKVLALVLALAMVMTMFAGAISIEAQADDYADLSAAGQDAYDVLNVLGVVTGYTDNTVRGNVPVTRAEAAAFIYRLKTGDVDGTAAFYGDATLPFSDYIADWAKPYVAFANLNGIMVGANGQFRPDDYVTGLEFAKMVLVALGYDATANGFVGSNWAYNVATKATQVGILKGINATLEGAMTRENVMIMLANAVYTDMAGSNQPTLGEKVFDLLDLNAVLVANDHGAIGAYWVDDSALSVNAAANSHIYRNFADYISYNNTAAGYSRFVYKDYSVNEANAYEYNVITAAISSDSADLGKEYRILTTGFNSLTYPSNEIREVYGVIGESENATITYGQRDSVKVRMTAALPNGVLEVGGKNMASAGEIYNATARTATPDKTIFLNGSAVLGEALDGKADDADDDLYGPSDWKGAVKDTAAAALGNSTAPVYYVDNNQDGIVDFLYVTAYTLGTVVNVTDEAVVISAKNANTTTTLKTADYTLTNADALAVGDYVAYYKTDSTFIKKLDVVSGAVTGLVDGAYTINGVSYKLSEIRTARAAQFLAGGVDLLSASQFTFITDEDADSHYIVDVMVNENTSFSEYGVVADKVELSSWTTTAAGSYYYKPFIRIFTDDNTFIIKSIASVNGITTYQYINMVGLVNTPVLNAGDLIAYVVDGDDVHITLAADDAGKTILTDADYAAATGSFYATSSSLKWDNTLQYWTLWNGAFLDTTSATVFAIDELAAGTNAHDTTKWKAYKNNFYAFNDIPSVGGEYIAYKYSGYSAAMAKVLKVELATIPATTLGANGNLIIANGGLSLTAYDAETNTYTYSVAVVSPFGQTKDAVSFQSRSKASALTYGLTITKGQAYKLNDADGDGYVDYVSEITARLADYDVEIASGKEVFAIDNFFNVQNQKVSAFYSNALNGDRVLVIENVGSIKLADDAVIYTVENLGSTDNTYDFATFDYYALINAFNGVNNSTAVHEGVYVSGILAADGVTLTTAIFNVVDAD